ncbi:uncharacterized protein [Venturia canescens]|uniref:uncharacterized protein isoform X2 n=1 Tax=Venturia canescens TaxID=32260 RepID=UPI001C9BC94C|nr:uncharacterized protein LOC122414558 isoform X2 [Venturia canescens]
MSNPLAEVTHHFEVNWFENLNVIAQLLIGHYDTLKKDRPIDPEVVAEVAAEFYKNNDNRNRKLMRSFIKCHRLKIIQIIEKLENLNSNETGSVARGGHEDLDRENRKTSMESDSQKSDSVGSVGVENPNFSVAQNGDINRLSGATEEMDGSGMLPTTPRAPTPKESGEVDAFSDVGAESPNASVAQDGDITRSSGTTEEMDGSGMLPTTQRAPTPKELGEVDAFSDVGAESPNASVAQDGDITRLSGATEEMDGSGMLPTTPRTSTPKESGEVDAFSDVGAESPKFSVAQDGDITRLSGATEEMDGSGMLPTTPRTSTPKESGEVDAFSDVGAESPKFSVAQDGDITRLSGATEEMDGSEILPTQPTESANKWMDSEFSKVVPTQIDDVPSSSLPAKTKMKKKTQQHRIASGIAGDGKC